MTYRSVFWDDESGRLKGFSATSKSDGTSVVKIEIEVRDPYRLAGILQDLAETKREQGKAKPEPKAPTRKVEHKPPLMLPFYPNTRGRP